MTVTSDKFSIKQIPGSGSSGQRPKTLTYVVLLILCTCIWISINSVLLSPPGGYWSKIKYISKISFGSRAELDDVNGLEQDNPFLIEFIQQYHLYPPSTREYRYGHLYGNRRKYINESRYVTHIIQSYLGNMTSGIFVEAGANNGADELSNTLVLERDYNWTGLLVEGNPIVFPRLRAAHRKSFKSDVLISKYPYSKLVVFKQEGNVYAGKQLASKITTKTKSGNGNASINNSTDIPSVDEDSVDVLAPDGKTQLFNFEILTVPLYSLIAACKFDRIDYLSLDVEGTELEILKNFPFDKVIIRTMIVEVNVMGANRTQQLVDFLQSKGYHKHEPKPTPRDLIFVHNSVLSEKL